jgi:hypothetical protein
MRMKLLSAAAPLFAWCVLAGAAVAAPDLSGTYALDQPPGWKPRPGDAPLTEKARAEAAADAKFAGENKFIMSEAHTKCWPAGMPGLMQPPYGIHFMQTKERLAILSEVSSLPRMIYLDQKAHPDYVMPSWNGHSIGRWEGDTLVVDTIGFNGRSNRVSEKMRIAEKIYPIEGGAYLVAELTLHDPETYTAPYTVKFRYKKVEGEAAEMIEYACEVIQENLEVYNAALRKAGITPQEPHKFE